MATNTAIIALRKPDGTDFVSRTLDLNNNWDSIDSLFHPSTGHKHTGAGTNGPNLLLSQSTEVDDDAGEAATLDTLTASTRLIANMNRIRYWITQVSGVAWGSTITENLNTHRLNTTTYHGTTGFVTNTVALGTAAAAGVSTGLMRADATILAFDGTAPAASAVGDAGVVGSVNLAARRDHKHPREAFATNTVTLSTAAGAGSAVTLMRSDSVIAAFDGIAPTVQVFGDAAVIGVINFAARRDHKHGFPSIPYGAAITTSLPGDVASGGASGNLARDDHRHGRETNSGAYVKLAELVLAVDTLQLDFTSIPATYKHLQLRIITRGTSASPGAELDMWFNNDNSASYDYIYAIVTSSNTWQTTAVTTAGAMEMGSCATSNSPVGIADTTVIEINGYAQTTFQKAAISNTQQKRSESTGGLLRAVRAGWWRNTAAINRVTIMLGQGNFATGTIATLFGVE